MGRLPPVGDHPATGYASIIDYLADWFYARSMQQAACHGNLFGRQWCQFGIDIPHSPIYICNLFGFCHPETHGQLCCPAYNRLEVQDARTQVARINS
jgi:hypothetical protein